MKSFILGLLTGIILTFAALFCIGLMNQNSENTDPVQYLDQPMSYENKTKASFKVFQVLGNAALAKEASDEIGGDVMYLGNVVMILGNDFYSDQVITIENPQRIGTYNYTTNGGMPKTVPVIEGTAK